jgi:hypothetical protein
MDGDEPAAKRGAIVKRRWAIIPRRGGRAVILATVGAIAFGNATPGGDPGQSPTQGDNQELATTVDEDDDQR